MRHPRTAGNPGPWASDPPARPLRTTRSIRNDRVRAQLRPATKEHHHERRTSAAGRRRDDAGGQLDHTRPARQLHAVRGLERPRRRESHHRRGDDVRHLRGAGQGPRRPARSAHGRRQPRRRLQGRVGNGGPARHGRVRRPRPLEDGCAAVRRDARGRRAQHRDLRRRERTRATSRGRPASRSPTPTCSRPRSSTASR